ncbi:hypothetical protein NDU88_005247 [Pleurodeles waltl]|uniref:Uncharacterized protein n=1 Tax=Pleurodeles waltl TaxID=8319 RepID=A0AAV7LWV6_PLEWA|nr:hypothetical protein NDU88_005247 [Pleurodeles waltl]
MEMEIINVGNFTKVELQNPCKERGLNVGKKASKVDLQIALQAYEDVKRLQAAIEDYDTEEDLGPIEDENYDPEKNTELTEEHPCPLRRIMIPRMERYQKYYIVINTDINGKRELI